MVERAGFMQRGLRRANGLDVPFGVERLSEAVVMKGDADRGSAFPLRGRDAELEGLKV